MALKWLFTDYNYCNLHHKHNSETEAERCDETQLQKINAKNEQDEEKKDLKKRNEKNEVRIKELEKELQKQKETATNDKKNLQKKFVLEVKLRKVQKKE
ncbi:uncharacterized protein LOC132750753 [Ruditapes philippinarum]|uniref:uncharacterized protein LOC132750753 n=1 Tax=Ruditapes philippinarum TaxID=129788 RepID=UPI00295C2771|nr:uncharacterized protein LOC132750753 [Ruditapes philippinarum]